MNKEEAKRRVKIINEKLKGIISYNVRYYRTLRGMSEEELASYCGKKKEYIKKLEDGKLKSNPPIDTIDAMAHALNIRFVDLIKEIEDEINEKQK